MLYNDYTLTYTMGFEQNDFKSFLSKETIVVADYQIHT